MSHKLKIHFFLMVMLSLINIHVDMDEVKNLGVLK